jgi:hypothetical protein
MVKRHTIYRPKEQWLEIIAAWKASGKSQKVWCEEHSIPPTSLYGAISRLESHKHGPLKRSDFVAIQPKQASGLQLSYKGLSIHLPADFDEQALARFLRVVGELPC